MENLNRIAESYSSLEWVRPVLQLIPFGVGSAIDSLLGNRAEILQMSRIRALLDGVKRTLEKMDEEKVDKDFLNTDDFYFLCRGVFEKVTEQRSWKKIELFTNVFVRGILKTRMDLDLTNLYLEILDEMLDVELVLLGQIAHISTNKSIRFIPIKDLLEMNIGLISTAANARFLDHLEQHQLIQLTEAYESDLESDSYSLTSLGREFTEVISAAYTSGDQSDL